MRLAVGSAGKKKGKLDLPTWLYRCSSCHSCSGAFGVVSAWGGCAPFLLWVMYLCTCGFPFSLERLSALSLLLLVQHCYRTLLQI